MKKYVEINNYSYIHIGISSTNEKILYIKTSLKLSKKFYSYPFSSTKMRYQYPEMFSYNLILEKSEYINNKNYNFYKLLVNRSDKIICSVTAKFFYNDGWKIDLYAVNIPDKIDISNSFIKLDIIKKYFPKNYGEITIDLPNNYTKPKIGIVMPLFSRNQYVKKCFESLKKSNLKSCIFLMMDESLSKDINEDKIKTNEIIKNFAHNDCIVIKIHKSKHGNMFESILKGFDFLGQFCPTLITVDSDVIFKENWVIEIMKNFILEEKENYNKPIILTAYNSISHNIKEDKHDFYIKESLGGCNMCFSCDDYFNIFRFMMVSYKWDTLISNYCKNNSTIICTKPSQIEHIGEESSGHRMIFGKNKKDLKSSDKSIDFYL